MSNIKTVNVIINPISGQYKFNPLLLKKFLGIKNRKIAPPHIIQKKISNFLKPFDIYPTFFITEKKGDATQFATQAVTDNIDLVIAIGGDGTINEVINGLAHSNVLLGVIPLGTANIFGIEFNLPHSIETACHNIFNGTEHLIDLGKVDSQYFVCMAGIGIDALVIKNTSLYLKRLIGPLSYIFVAIQEFFNYTFKSIVFTVDDDPVPKSGTFVVVGNIKYYGGTLKLLPNADPSDGYLNICCFKGRHITYFLYEILKIRFGLFKSQPQIESFRAKEITFENGLSFPIQTDGEYLDTPLTKITISPKALRVVY